MIAEVVALVSPIVVIITISIVVIGTIIIVSSVAIAISSGTLIISTSAMLNVGKYDMTYTVTDATGNTASITCPNLVEVADTEILDPNKTHSVIHSEATKMSFDIENG